MRYDAKTKCPQTQKAAGGRNLLCFLSLFLMFCAAAIYRALLYGNEPYANLLLVALSSAVLSFFLTAMRPYWLFVLLSIPLMWLSGNETFVVVVYRHYMKAMNVVSMFITNTTWETKVMGLPPFNLPLQYYRGYAINQKIAQAASGPHITPDCQQLNPGEREAYVLFIGESVVYDHLSLAGYNRPTTPLMDGRDNLTLFTDYMTNATLTLLAAPMLMTDATTDDFFRSYSGVNSLQVFGACGFKTFVLVCTNHLEYDTYLTTSADEVISVGKDIDIPAKVDSLTNIYPKTFFIVQGLGNHCYFYNFEEQDNLFTPNPYYGPSAQSDSLYYNAYDCTLRYTDRVVDGVINAIDKEGMTSLMLFASDHGENVNPGDERRSVSMNPMRSEYHVPLIIWRSQTWIEQNPEKEQCILAAKDRPTNTDNVFYTLCDAASILLPDSLSKPEWAITSPTFTQHKRTLLTPDGKTILELD